MIKAVLFDAGDVLYRRRRQHPLLSDFLARFGLTGPDYNSPDLQSLKRAAFLGDISRAAFFDRVLDACGLPASHWDEGRVVLAQMQEAVDFVPEVPDTLRALRQAGVKLGIVTNTFDATQIKLGWFARVSIDSLWDSFATSCELGLVKPGPGIYLTALAPLDVYPDEAAFVGHAQSELDGAKRLGLTTVAFNRDHDGVTADHTIASFAELAGLVSAGKGV